jgi:uncharacterized protein (TIGR02145 family)
MFYKSILNAVAVAVAVMAVMFVGCESGDDDGGEGNHPIVKGTFTDSRDGTSYKTVKIGTQTWMAENLNYVTGNSACYDDNPSNCTTYGRLYNWATALAACPAGWHLPSGGEWMMLKDYVGGWSTAGKKLKSTSGWKDNGNGTDDFGWSALPGGMGYVAGSFDYASSIGNWWSAREDGSYAFYWNIYYYTESIHENTDDNTLLFSVRCVQDN